MMREVFLHPLNSFQHFLWLFPAFQKAHQEWQRGVFARGVVGKGILISFNFDPEISLKVGYRKFWVAKNFQAGNQSFSCVGV